MSRFRISAPLPLKPRIGYRFAPLQGILHFRDGLPSVEPTNGLRQQNVVNKVG